MAITCGAYWLSAECGINCVQEAQKFIDRCNGVAQPAPSQAGAPSPEKPGPTQGQVEADAALAHDISLHEDFIDPGDSGHDADADWQVFITHTTKKKGKRGGAGKGAKSGTGGGTGRGAAGGNGRRMRR